MFGWIKNISDKIKDLNTSVDTYKKETDNQQIPSLAYVNRAKKFIEKSRFIDAKAVLEEALEITDKDALVYKYLGISEEKMGNYDAAIEAFKKSAEINPQDKNIWHKLGLAQITVRSYEDAEISFEKADKISPVNTDIQTGWGMALFKQKKYNQAYDKFIKATKINRYNFAAMLLAAIVEIRLGKYDDAENKLSFLTSANPNESSTYEYANLYYLKGNYDAAIRYALQSVEFNSNMLPAYLLLGKIYSIKFDYENSTKYFTRAQEKNLINSVLYTEWGNALVRLCRFEEAKEIFQKALLEDTDCVEAQAGMALCAAETKDFEKAHNFITFAEEKEADSVFLIEAKGLSAFAYGNTEEALCYFKEALKRDSNDVYNYFRLAKCYEKLEKDDMVKDSFDKLLKFNPDCVKVYVEYAKYLMKQNDHKDAQRKLRKAEKLDENNQEILNLLFYTSYILVKENVCEYNVKEAIMLADRIEKFEYPELRADLEVLLKNIKENQ